MLTIITLILSCGQNSNKQKELELRERELALKEKELALKEKDTINQKITTSKPDTTKKIAIVVKKNPQIPKDGTYTYSIANSEFSTCERTFIVRIIGDSITVFNEKEIYTPCGGGKKGEIYDKGILMKHKKTGNWIIAHNPKDIFAEYEENYSDYCIGDLTIIDFKYKIIYQC